MQVDEETPITAMATTSNGNTKPSSSSATSVAAGVDDSILMKGDAGMNGCVSVCVYVCIFDSL